METTGNKIKRIDDLALALSALQGQGRKIVHGHGVFDLLQIGHIKHLEAARQLGDALVVTLIPDHFVNKGPHRVGAGDAVPGVTAPCVALGVPPQVLGFIRRSLERRPAPSWATTVQSSRPASSGISLR
jgi:hypothetical protein